MQATASQQALAEVHVYERDDEGSRSGSEIQAIGRFTPTDEGAEFAPSSTAAYVIETVGLLVSSVVAAVFLDSVLVVWAVMGSTVSFLIAFTLPALMWLRVHAHLAARSKVRLTWGLLALSVVLAIACTAQTVAELDHPACPAVHIKSVVADT
jgi:hypothetical protein